MKQTVGNACGTIGLLHALGNLTSEVKLGKFSTVNYLSVEIFSVSYSYHYFSFCQLRGRSLITFLNLLQAWIHCRLFLSTLPFFPLSF